MINIKKQHLEAALIVAPKNSIRYYLNNVLLEITECGSVYVVATDGCIMFVGEIDAPEFTSKPKSLKLMILRSVVEQALKVKDKSLNIELKQVDDFWQLGSVLFSPLDNTYYQNWRRVNVSPGEINTNNPEPAQYNPELLLLANKALAKWIFNKKKCNAMLHQRGNDSGVLVHSGDNSAHVVVMPWAKCDTKALPRVVKPYCRYSNNW